ncbi:MAG: hypothetical protein OXQ89_14385 [Rhodospirillaceae bacterium]|nr:hypothetical protein [Rhodospirillaceae bacterium]MDE0362800.1 hypothetical protein [Rhodospirillaceae bacterium]
MAGASMRAEDGDPGVLAQRLQAQFGYGFQRREDGGLWRPFVATETGEGHALMERIAAKNRKVMKNARYS